jgi:hypothetical protein
MIVSHAYSYLDILVSLVQGGGAVDAAVSAAAVAGVQNMVTNGAPPQQKRAYKALCALMQGDLQVRPIPLLFFPAKVIFFAGGRICQRYWPGHVHSWLSVGRCSPSPNACYFACS